MQSFLRNLIRRQAHFKSPAGASNTSINGLISSLKSDYLASDGVIAFKNRLFSSFHSDIASGNGANAKLRLCFPHRNMTTAGNPAESPSAVHSESGAELSSRIKFKRLDKTARNIMQILDKEAVQEVKTQREIPDIRPGHIVQLKVEVPENKRRVSIVKGIVIARRNAGINTTFRLRRLVAGVGVECLYPLYSPNIKEIQILEKKKVRRAKLYYLRDKMNALKK